MKLLKTHEIMDIAFNQVHDDDNVYFRMDYSIIAIEKSSGTLIWEFEIEFDSPVGAHHIWLAENNVVFGAVNLSNNNQVFGVLDKKGVLLDSVETPYRVYEDGGKIRNQRVLEFLSFNHTDEKRYYCQFDVELMEVKVLKVVDDVVDTLFFNDEKLFISGGGGLYNLTSNGIDKVNEQSIIRALKSENEIWFLEELQNNKYNCREFTQYGKFFSFDLLTSEKSVFSNIQLLQGKMYLPLGELGGMKCLEVGSGNLLWEYGKEEVTINSYTIVEDSIFTIVETSELDIEILVLNGVTGELMSKLNSQVEPEFIKYIESNLYVSGLLGIEVYTNEQ